MGRIGGSKRVTRMRKYGAEIYQELAAQTGMQTGSVPYTRWPWNTRARPGIQAPAVV